MKLKIAYIIATLGAAFVFNACKKDLGNYDYSTVNIAAIDTAGIGGARYVERYGMLDINPKITYEGGNMTALKYKWIMYPLTTGSTAPTKPARTLSEQLHLTAPVTETVGEYRLELIVTDTVNQLKSNMIFTVVVSVGIEYGVMVLHGTADSSDVDFLITADAVPLSGISPRRLRGLYAASTGAKLPGVPRFVAQERRTGSTQNWIMLGSDKHISRVSGSDFSLLREDKSFYRRSDAVVAPETFMFLNNSYSALINAGKLHVYTTTYEVDALFSAPVPGDYELAPYLANASASGMVAVVYDKERPLHSPCFGSWQYDRFQSTDRRR
ncbi:PKD-like family lipoprotein [Chitinophaga sedimenti]|uniref:PKD-like family lipoprotein n=1 Tax=Chitinophaga sedimenti TaxID=2033606 RepID=UPI00200479FB|nr:PKD-like family lipoprotein [Chitinophaga sedimenti]MCK7555730.1 PKD-like family lipoprotein [Chitinophaga sedimenti]